MASQMKTLEEGNQYFACALYKHILKTNSSGNLFFSPLSLSTVLSMTLAGAQGDTKSQILKVLGLEELEGPDLHIANRDTISKLTQGETVQIANALFIQNGLDILKSFVDVVVEMYSAGTENVDFEKDPQTSALKVNDWVNKATKGKIPKLVDEFEPNTVMVILNAIYFKSFWAKQFKVSNTTVGPFRVTQDESVDVNMMYQSGKFKYSFNESADCEILELPYNDNKTSMLIFLPKSIDGLSKIESSVNPSFLKDVVSSLGNARKIQVTIPSFKLEETYSLSSILSEMGMKDLFQRGRANLRGISDKKCLYASEVIHKSFIEVNEEGTEAAAVSGVIMARSCAMINMTFTADHPFLFCILDYSSNSVLFLGSLKKPLPAL